MCVHVSIYAGAEAGKTLLMLTANDIDLQPVLTYDLVAPTFDLFSIDKYSGQLSLTGQLDYETGSHYNLTVLVSS